MKTKGAAHQKAAVESVHFPLWTYNPATGKVKLDSADKSDTVSFAKNAVSKELGENRGRLFARPLATLKSGYAFSAAIPPARFFAAHQEGRRRAIGAKRK